MNEESYTGASCDQSRVAFSEIDDGTIEDTLFACRTRSVEKDNGRTISEENYDLETVWQDYWGKYGDYLVWEGWAAKYPDQIDYENLQSVPAIAEVEVDTEALESQKGHGQEDDNAEHTDCVKNENKQSELVQDESTLSKSKTHSYNFKNPNGVNILSALQNRTESNSGEVCNVNGESNADNIVNEQNEMFNMMHSYSCYEHSDNASISHMSGKDYTINADVEHHHTNDETAPAQGEDFSKAWEELWNEHYTESYWYYYNQFAEKFEKIIQKTPEDATVAEGVAIVNENGELVIVDDGTSGHINTEQSCEIETVDICHHTEDADNSVSQMESIDDEANAEYDTHMNEENVIYVVADPDNPEALAELENMSSEQLAKLTEDIAACLNGVNIDGGNSINNSEANTGTGELDTDKVYQTQFKDAAGEFGSNEEPTDGNRKRKQERRNRPQQSFHSSQNSAFTPYHGSMCFNI